MKRAVLTGAVLLCLAGCARGVASPSANGSRSATAATATAVAAISSPAPSPTTTAVEQPDPKVVTGRAMLSDASMKRLGLHKIVAKKYVERQTWFFQCSQPLPDDALLLGTTSATWQLNTAEIVSQSASAYLSYAAKESLQMAKGRYRSCRTYTTDNHVTYGNITPFKQPKVKGADDQLTWCQDTKGSSLCAGIYRHGNVLTQVYDMTADKASGQYVLGLVTPALERQLASLR